MDHEGKSQGRIHIQVAMMRMMGRLMGRTRMDGKDNVDHEVYGSDEESPEGCAKCVLPVCTRVVSLFFKSLLQSLFLKV